MLKQCTVINTETNEIFEGAVDTELENEIGYLFREATQAEITANEQEHVTLESNNEARTYLAETDWQVIRHRDQLAQGGITSLSQIEYEALLDQRQLKRDSITS